jgi:putative ABC transport system substrate-binding protein
MKPRRKFLLASGALLAAPLVRAQPAKMHRVAWLSVLSEKGSASYLDIFLQGMAAHGYVPGRNLVIDARYGDNSRETLERLAVEAAALKPAVFVTMGPALHAARKTPGKIPVVFGFSGDPVELGIAQSLARPGGRFTGVSFLAYELSGKRVELMHEVLPKMKRIGVLSNPHHVGDRKEFEATREAAVRYGLDVSHHPAGNAAELERALEGIAAARAEAVVIHPDGFMVQNRETIARFSLQNRIPAISGWAAIAEGGNLMTYGPIQQESFRRLAYYVDRILRGASPGELPIELPAKLEMVVNLRTAKALGLAIPQSILLRADRVIE